MTPTYLLSSEDKDNLLNPVDHLEGPFLPNSFSEPIIKTKVLINQEIPHGIDIIQVWCQV